MNCQSPPLYLPILRKENVANPSIFNILKDAANIWPGFEHMPQGYWQPSNYAFAPKLAKACFDDLCNMSEAALFGMPIHSIMGAQDKKFEANSMEERDMLTHFANTGEAKIVNSAHDEHILQAAQKILLWAWLLEERFYEINELTNSYSTSMQDLADTLGIDKDEEFSDLERIESSLTTNDALLPPWRLVLENVTLFLPADCTIVVNHKDMAEHISDICADIIQTKENIKQCHTSMGHVLGKNERQMRIAPWLQNKFHFMFLENM